MKNDLTFCAQLKSLLVEEGQGAVHGEAALLAHLKTCVACQKLFEAWNQIPDLLDKLPEHEPDEDLLRQVREKAASEVGMEDKAHPSSRTRFLAPSLASVAVLLAAIGLSRELLMHETPGAPLPPARRGDLVKSPEEAPAFSGPKGVFRLLDKRNPSDQPQSAVIGAVVKNKDDALDDAVDDGSLIGEKRPAPMLKETDQLQSMGQRMGQGSSVLESNLIYQKKQERARRDVARQAKPLDTGLERAASKDRDEEVKLAVNMPTGREYEEHGEPGHEIFEGIAQSGAGGFLRSESEGAGRARDDKDGADWDRTALNGSGLDFLGHYQQTTDLQFQPAIGYWANTYVPGDPEIRLLSARLAQWDRSWLEDNAALEQDVQTVPQAFDAPANNALALSLMADSNAVPSNEGVTRMRLQVGIRGIEHRRGQRPAMNVAVVVDLPADAPDEVRIATRALLDAVLQSKQAGDHFSLVMTAQGLVVPPAEFRFGSLQLAKQIILGQEPAAANDGLTLHEALKRAGSIVQQTDDPSRPLGSSSVLLIGAAAMPEIDRLAELAHERAEKGVTLSVFPLGKQPQAAHVEKLVLAGLGNRRYLEEPAQARQLIEEELHASSRAVARAARLSIRLAPGVKLIDVIGSERLDTRRAQRVRDIENSMDQRLSSNLGIQADRGEDEEGIQIVIPSIYSADDVTVLLDIVTDRPGAVADVSLRYKDLVFLRNGNLQGHLELPGGEVKRGPAELAVLKNLLSTHFAEAVRRAADALGERNPDAAIAVLSSMRNTIEQARLSISAWTGDPDLKRDSEVLERYIAALLSPDAGAHQSFLTDSLRFAAWAKTHKELEEWQQ